jgi:vacuolar-type H+-ATPase subunit E/Vma4
MSEETGRGSEDGIIDKIMSDGRDRAARVLDGAVRTADGEKAKARAEAEKIRTEILDRARRKAATLRSKEVAGAHIEAKRILLRAREKAISKVFDAIAHELEEIHKDCPRYRSGLVNLAAEAVRAIEKADVTVALGKDDEDLAGDGLGPEIAGRLETLGVPGVNIEIAVDPSFGGGGCVARSKDSRIIFDNTFKRRLERMKPSLRSTIVSEVLKSDG